MSAIRALAPLSLAAALAAGSSSATIAPIEVTRTLPLRADGSVEVKTFKGSVTVTTAAAPEVQIVARVVPDGEDDEMAEKVRDTRVAITGGGESVRIESDYSHLAHHSLPHRIFHIGHSDVLPLVRYEIRMPATARLVIDDYKSAIHVSDLRGDLRLKTYKGDAKLERLGGRAHVETYKGEVHALFAKLAGDSSFQTYKGTCAVTLPSAAPFDLDASIGRRGDLESDFPVDAAAGRHGHERRSVRSAVNGGGPRLSLSTYKGLLKLRKG